ncbi:MAG: patatin-like phospholipase family protein [Nonlabens sp.]
MNGMVLSGGGHRGAAHLGILKALGERNIAIDVYSGSSAGSLVGALMAAGHSIDDALNLFKRSRLFSITNFARNKAGFVNSDVFHKLLIEYFPANSFEALEKPLFVTASNLITAKTKVFKSGELIPALLASSAVPGVFTPVEVGGKLYTDGGILDNFPIKPLRNKDLNIYGSYVCPLKDMQAVDFKRSFDVMNRALHLKMHSLSLNKFKECRSIFMPMDLTSYHLFQSGQIDKIFEIGYNEAVSVLDNV